MTVNLAYASRWLEAEAERVKQDIWPRLERLPLAGFRVELYLAVHGSLIMGELRVHFRLRWWNPGQVLKALWGLWGICRDHSLVSPRLEFSAPRV